MPTKLRIASGGSAVAGGASASITVGRPRAGPAPPRAVSEHGEGAAAKKGGLGTGDGDGLRHALARKGPGPAPGMVLSSNPVAAQRKGLKQI